MKAPWSTFALIVLGLTAPAAHAEIFNNEANRTLTVPTLKSGGAMAEITGSSDRRDDCDQIFVRSVGQSMSGPGSVEILLENNSPWWKALELFVDGSRGPGLRAPDGPSQAPGSPLVVFPNEFDSAQLVFVKPKFLGVATCVYQLTSWSNLANHRVVFTWQRQSC